MSEPNYRALVAEARLEFAGWLKVREARYRYRARARNLAGLPTLCIVGAGESGKDTVAKILVKRCGLDYGGGTSQAFADLIAHGLGVSAAEAYEQRRENREYWFRWLSEYRVSDPTGVARIQLSKSDFCLGIRGREELEMCVRDKVVTLPLWVERPGYTDGAHEVTRELVLELGGKIIDNNGNLANLERNVLALAEELGYSISGNPVH